MSSDPTEASSNDATPKNIRILIADDHEVIRMGIRSLVEGTDIEVVGEVDCAEQAIEMTHKLRPDITLLDVRMKGDGLGALSRIKEELPDQVVIMLSTYDNPTYIARSIALGASGYLLKGERPAQMLEVIRQVAAGGSGWEGEELRRVWGALSTRRYEGDIEVPLTLREHEVLRHVAHGLTNKEISAALGISYETVKEHVQHILQKVGVADRTQAAVWAVRKEIV